MRASSTPRHRLRVVLTGVAVVAVILPVVGHARPAAAGTCTIAAAGDIAEPGAAMYETAALITRLNPTKVIALGDESQGSGTAAELQDYYAPSWGVFKNNTWPTPGNHDYVTNAAAAYFAYFGYPPYYSNDICGWHVISLDRNLTGTAAEAQLAWLQNDLAAHKGVNTFAFWHQPRWSNGYDHGNDPLSQDLWSTVVNAGVKFVLGGHEHDYERFPEMDAAGNALVGGTREWVVGTGGSVIQGPFRSSISPVSEKRLALVHGALLLSLRSDGYDWQFIQTDNSVTDSGNRTFAPSSSTTSSPSSTSPSTTPTSTSTAPMLPSTPPTTATGTAAAATVTKQGYYLAGATGQIYGYGDVATLSTSASPHAPIVGAAMTASANGLWRTTTTGEVLVSGDAPLYGSLGQSTKPLNKPIMGMAATPASLGYWLVASDGGIFSYGDAAFYGSTGNLKLNKPVVGMAATPSGLGYWLVATDGGIFSYGDAAFYGSTGNLKLNKPVVGMAASPTGHGYWLVASDGGIFAFGDAAFYGSTGSLNLNKPIAGMAPSTTGLGYWFVASDGGIFSFGDARFRGSAAAQHIDNITAMCGTSHH